MTRPVSPHTRPIWKQLLLRRLKMLLGLVVILVILGGGTYLLAPQWLMHAWNWQQAEAAGLSTHGVQIGRTHWVYDEGGKGPTIVLLHGYGADRNVWLKTAKQLTPHFHVIIPDLPGTGGSTLPENADDAIDAQARRLHAFVHTLGLHAFTLVGHSMGGAIAGLYAADHPHTVSGLVLMDSFGLSAKPDAFSRQLEAGNNPYLFDSAAGFHRLQRLRYAQPPSLPGRFVDVLVKRNKAHHAFLQKAFRALHSDVLENRLGALSMPVTGLWCRDDKITDISALNTLRSGLTHSPDIGATVISHCGHVPQLEHPEETARVIQGFVLKH